MNLIGIIQWWDDKYGKGVIEDADGNEYYFDKSVILRKPRQKYNRKQIVSFQLNEYINGAVCAYNVSILKTTTTKGGVT